ncbi:universal stress protein [Labrys neptuniae]
MQAHNPMSRSSDAETSTDPQGYKSIAVHLDGSVDDEVRLAHGEMLAAQFGSHLTGLYTSLMPDISLYSSDLGTAASMEMVNQIRQRADVTIGQLQQRFERLSVPNDIRRIEDAAVWLPSLVASEARTSDLFVATCPRKHPTDVNWKRVIEAAMFESGRGVYLVPPGQQPRQPIRTVLVGWADGKEAARAVAEALPLLRLASLVKVVAVDEIDREDQDESMDLADIATYLARHGVETTVDIRPVERDVSITLQREAHRISADLIVVGAYGHSRLREWILGGTTVELLENSDIPLLMAH